MLKHAAKGLLAKIAPRLVLPSYRFNFTPDQLNILCGLIEQTRDVPGPIVEIGCSNGWTTVFLCKYMESRGIDKPYIAIDTFSGFVEEDIAVEEKRGKPRRAMNGFRTNDQRWFDQAMTLNGITRVQSIAADVNRYDFSNLRPSFALVDVDLYRPVLSALNGIYKQMPKGGVIVVDDCMANQVFDGALAAYQEFIGKHGLQALIVGRKLGLIERHSVEYSHSM